MNLRESDDKKFCENCDEYTYVFEIEGNGFTVRLCKKCLLELLKLIIER